MAGPLTLYAGMAGDTDEGRFVSAGLYRSRNDGPWQRIATSLDPPPEVRAILVDPAVPERVTIATQSGLYGSDDHGDRWRPLGAPAPGLAIWSLYRHPDRPAAIFAGYEPCAVYRSDEDGENWQRLSIASAWPAITAGPEMPKRVSGIAIEPGDPDTIYASVEIGGLLRSRDGGATWEAAVDGLYVHEDAVDLHGVIAGPAPGEVTVTTRVGAFQSRDYGAHWRTLPLPPLREKGSYCRAIAREVGGASRLFIGAGNDFDGDQGALFASSDDGATFQTVPLPGPTKSAVFAIAVNPARPASIACATKNGGVFFSGDRGEKWRYLPLPRGAGHVFSLAVA
jgi:photosystem II stability/assembly factor-like uncharacterized protein